MGPPARIRRNIINKMVVQNGERHVTVRESALPKLPSVSRTIQIQRRSHGYASKLVWEFQLSMRGKLVHGNLDRRVVRTTCFVALGVLLLLTTTRPDLQLSRAYGRDFSVAVVMYTVYI